LESAKGELPRSLIIVSMSPPGYSSAWLHPQCPLPFHRPNHCILRQPAGGAVAVAFYQAQSAFQQDGLAGLVPRKRGPKQAHKLTEEVLTFIEQVRQKEPLLDCRI